MEDDQTKSDSEPRYDLILAYQQTLREAVKKRKVADRPHWITVGLGLTGPILSIVAILFTFLSYRLANESFRVSQQSLATSQESLRKGQRPYLSISQGKIADAVMEDLGGVASFSLLLEFTMDNLGNTPATLAMMDFEVYAGAQGWELTTLSFSKVPYNAAKGSASSHLTVRDLGTLGQRGSRDVNVHLIMYSDELSKKPWILTSPFTYQLVGRLVYSDVFNESHEIRWCWLMQRIRGVQIPEQCESTWPPTNDKWKPNFAISALQPMLDSTLMSRPKK